MRRCGRPLDVASTAFETAVGIAAAFAGYGYWSLSAYLKHKVKTAVSFISDFEEAIAHECVKRGLDGVVCGHIHHAEIREMTATDNPGKVLYLNSGDWVESLTALEYHKGKWDIFKYEPKNFNTDIDEDDKTDAEDLDAKMDVNLLLERFKQEVH